MAAKSIEVKRGGSNEAKSVVIAKGLMPEDVKSLNGMFGESLSFKPNKEDDVVEIRSTSSEHTAVHIAVELEDMGFPWKNPKSLGFRKNPGVTMV